MTTHIFSSAGLSDSELKQAVGQRYHVGLSAAGMTVKGGAGGAASLFYGYLLKPDTDPQAGFGWRTDTATKEALIQYASQQLIDRDLAFFPRVTDGDFSGGGYQEVFLDPKRYFDSDLDPRVPGFLTLRAQWTRVAKAGLTIPANSRFMTVVWKGDFWFSFGEANGNIYSANGGATTSPVAARVISIDTDGTYLYAGTTTQAYRYDGTTWTQITSAINNALAFQWWVVNQGTNGYFLYYSAQGGTLFNLLYKIDLTQAFPIAAGSQPQVPVGSNAVNIIDLCQYQTAIAILTVDGANATTAAAGAAGFDVWYHDGVNMTRIIRQSGYQGTGITNVLGELYIGAFAQSQVTTPKLFRISSGGFDVVAAPGSPFPVAGQTCLGPVGSGQYVYWPIIAPSINGISGAAAGYVLQYDTITGAVTHLPVEDATDFATVSTNHAQLRCVAAYGDSLAICYVNGTTGTLQYQQPAFGTLKYQGTGWLFSSHFDFATPGIVKRFKRIEIHHAPLNAGEQVLIKAWVDNLDPLSLTTASAPVPAGATATNTSVGTTITSMTFGGDTVGKTLTVAIELTAGTNQLTTPRINWFSVEVGGTWVAEMDLVCSSRRNTLAQEPDTQGATAADLAYLLYLTQENGNLLTFYHPNGQTYTMTVESLRGWNPTILKTQEGRPQDEEYVVHAILRQVA